jgi:hypothetical protein
MDEMSMWRHVAKLAEDVEVASNDAMTKTFRHDEGIGRRSAKTGDGTASTFVESSNDVFKAGRKPK